MRAVAVILTLQNLIVEYRSYRTIYSYFGLIECEYPS